MIQKKVSWARRRKMNDRFVGDIGDFGKFLLLNYLVRDEKRKLGINWYYNTRDGNENCDLIKYLDSKRYLCLKNTLGKISENIFHKLKNMKSKNRCSLKEIMKNEILPVERTNFFPNVKMFEEQEKEKLIVPRNCKERKEWLEASVNAFGKDIDLIFLDPDTGVAFDLNKSKIADNKNSREHVCKQDIAFYLKKYPKADLIIYNHGMRLKEGNNKFAIRVIKPEIEEIARQSKLGIRSVRFLKFRRWTMRFYIFIIRNRATEDKLSSFVRLFDVKRNDVVKCPKNNRKPIFEFIN